MAYRRLTAEERQALAAQGCTAESWDRVEVTEPFQVQQVRRVHFGGSVRIGRGACLIDIRRLADYDLEDGVAVQDVGLLAMEGASSFGNGTRIHVLNEAGGRSLCLHDRLSAQEAYLAVMHRHRPGLAQALEGLAAARARAAQSGRGTVRRGSRILRCGTVCNVAVGPHALLEGAAVLEEGTVAGAAEDPARIGSEVEAHRFIVLSGSRVESGALLDSCFVGQGVRIGRQFSAEHSALFTGSECDHGEMVSVLAGPFTVSHHKSTLLIGCCVSFFNAGSGTNMSNHMYKLGPVHQGILERGVKTGSDTYLSWPARVGAFSLVFGRHHANFDLTDLPFSYIEEEGGKTVVAAGVNLVNVGFRRDAEKWLDRDGRRDPDRLDRISHGLFNPYTAGRLRRGLAILEGLARGSPRERELVNYGGAYLRRLLLKSGIQFYGLALARYLGERLAARLQPLPESAAALRERLACHAGEAGRGDWWDVAGMIAPAAEVQRLEAELESGAIGSLGELEDRFHRLEQALPELEWSCCLGLLEERLGSPPAAAPPGSLAGVLEDWREAARKLNRLVLADAGKEYDGRARVGFGSDGGAAERDADFRAVRGEPADNAFLRQIEAETARVEQEAGRLIAWLRG